MSDIDASKDLQEAFNERGFLKRTCRLQKKEIIQEEYSDLEIEEGEITDDDSDEDYDPNAPRVKKKKKKIKLKAEENEKPKKERRQKKRQDFKPPSFDEVMKTQISHLARFIEYDEYDSCEESSSEYEEIAIPHPQPIQHEEQIPDPFILKEKKKRVVIYPWRPIGITGGSLGVEEAYLTTREPVNDVRKLIELENIF